jgi:hypothetical protein
MAKYAEHRSALIAVGLGIMAVVAPVVFPNLSRDVAYPLFVGGGLLALCGLVPLVIEKVRRRAASEALASGGQGGRGGGDGAGDVAVPSPTPSDLRIRDGRSRIGRLEIINSRGPAADLSNANVDIDHFTIRNDPPPAPNQPEASEVTAPENEALRLLSTEDFRARAKGEAKRLRAVETEFHSQYVAVWSAVRFVNADTTPEKKQELMRRQQLASEQLDERRLAIYRSGFHRDAVAVRAELWRRLNVAADDPHQTTCLDNGELNGDHPLLRAAEEIEALAERLL